MYINNIIDSNIVGYDDDLYNIIDEVVSYYNNNEINIDDVVVNYDDSGSPFRASLKEITKVMNICLASTLLPNDEITTLLPNDELTYNDFIISIKYSNGINQNILYRDILNHPISGYRNLFNTKIIEYVELIYIRYNSLPASNQNDFDLFLLKYPEFKLYIV